MQQIILVTYMYYVSKIIDLLDTVNNDFIMFVTFIKFTLTILHLQVFFILRKKNNQITFLHVYHHGGMVLATFVYFKFLSGKKKSMNILLDILQCETQQQNILQITIFYTGSHGTLLGVINSYVHVIMYGYYFMTSYRPELKNSLWWKKHITQVQLVS